MNRRIIYLVFCMFLLFGVVGSMSFVEASRSFTIFNSSNENQPYFSVNGSTGFVGLGTEDPSSVLQIPNNEWISGTNYADSGIINMFKINSDNQIEVGGPLNIGSFEFSPDSGLVSFVDMPVTSSAAAGTPEGYAFKIDGDNLMTIYSESDGLGGIQNERVDIFGDLNVSGVLHGDGSGLTNIPASNVNLATLSTGTGLTGEDYDGTTAREWNLNTTYTDGRYLRKDANTIQNDNLYIGTDQIRARDGAGLKVYDDGGNGLFVEDGGNVGIGTSSPSGPLHVFGRESSIIETDDNNDVVLTLRRSQATNRNITFQPAMYDGSSIYQAINFNGGGGTNPRVEFLGGQNYYFDGNVGIGTTSPNYKLEVSGNAKVSQNLTVSGMTIYEDTNGDMVFRA